MKKPTPNKCQICGRPIMVIIRGKSDSEKLCTQCLISHYPALKELCKVV
ncbi:MAG: hypothetical protein ACYC9O_03075 [Candidatus Latescibacterota bacterium]|jgi:hypothetical protein